MNWEGLDPWWRDLGRGGRLAAGTGGVVLVLGIVRTALGHVGVIKSAVFLSVWIPCYLAVLRSLAASRRMQRIQRLDVPENADQ